MMLHTNMTRNVEPLTDNSSENASPVDTKDSSLVEVLSTPHILGLSVFLVLQILLTIVGNVLVLRTVYVSKRLHSAAYVFIASLASADLVVGVLVIPVSLLYYITFNMKGRWIFGIAVCDAWILANMWFCMASIFSLCAVTWDRYVAVTSPLQYSVRMRNRKVINIIIAIWSASLIAAIINCYVLKIAPSRILCEVKGLPIEFAVADFLLHYLFPLSAIVFVNILIVKAVSRHMKRVKQLSPQSLEMTNNQGTTYQSQITDNEVGVTADTNSNSTQANPSVYRPKRNLKKEIKTFRTFLIVTGSFFISWTPFFFIILLDPVMRIDGMIMYISVILTYINSATNPLVYGIFNRDFRQAMFQSLRNTCTS